MIVRRKRNWTSVDYCYFSMERSPKEVDNIKGKREREERVCVWILGGFSKIGDYPG